MMKVTVVNPEKVIAPICEGDIKAGALFYREGMGRLYMVTSPKGGVFSLVVLSVTGKQLISSSGFYNTECASPQTLAARLNDWGYRRVVNAEITIEVEQ